MKTFREVLVYLVSKALNGNLNIEEFYSTFPDAVLKVSPFFKDVYDDIEDAVEHFPASFIKGTPKFDVYKTSKVYYKLLLDLKLLNSDIDEDELYDARKNELKKKFDP